MTNTINDIVKCNFTCIWVSCGLVLPYSYIGFLDLETSNEDKRLRSGRSSGGWWPSFLPPRRR